MNINQVEQELDHYGEIIVVLESGVEYELHKYDTEVDKEEGIVETEGMKNGDEYTVARFPSGVIEHFYYHKAN